MLFSNVTVLMDIKGYFQGQKCPIWTFVNYLGQYLRNDGCCDQCLYEVTYKIIYDLSVDLVTFDLELPLKVKSRYIIHIKYGNDCGPPCAGTVL